MELQFHKTGFPCLQPLKRELQNQEQTQEIRLPDGMPDIGRVIGAWGQPLIRSKEWRSGGMGVSGGVMAWVLYEPEEGGLPQSVETWLPFQLKWEFPDTDRDGTIQVACLLKSIDARTTSARKLMVRSCVGVMGEAYVPTHAQIAEPEQLPEDIQLLRQKYPMLLPMEAGERHFEMEEEISLSASTPAFGKLIYYTIQPEITESKVLAGKVVFRGGVILHILYLADDGTIQSMEQDFPFSMYSDLDADYDEDATVQICPLVTSLEVEYDTDGKLRMKAGLSGQYMICERKMVEVVEDAYSPSRKVVPVTESLQLPVILDEYGQTIHPEQTIEVQGKRVVDMKFYPDHPRLMHSDGSVELEFPGQFQMLYYDENDSLQSVMSRWDGNWSVPVSDNAKMEVAVFPTGRSQGALTGNTTQMRTDLLVNTRAIAQQGLSMVGGLEVGEAMIPDPNRPSLLLRRFTDETLWDIAKDAGSTVEAIQKANNLRGEPEPKQVLLIPIP